ncbi:MAG: ribosome maturation factor RimP [Terriglobales bacterium]
MALDLDHIRGIVQRVTASQGLELWDLEFHGGGKGRLLRIFIDKPEGVTHEDCANVSREVGTILDVEDPIPGTYTLEVSSPGLDRRLRDVGDYRRFTGSKVKLLTRELVENQKHFEGRLKEVGESSLMLEIGGSKKQEPRTVEIPLAQVEKANLVPEL